MSMTGFANICIWEGQRFVAYRLGGGGATNREVLLGEWLALEDWFGEIFVFDSFEELHNPGL